MRRRHCFSNEAATGAAVMGGVLSILVRQAPACVQAIAFHHRAVLSRMCHLHQDMRIGTPIQRPGPFVSRQLVFSVISHAGRYVMVSCAGVDRTPCSRMIPSCAQWSRRYG